MKKTFRKWTTIVAAASMILGLAAGCGSKETSQQSGGDTPKKDSEQAAPDTGSGGKVELRVVWWGSQDRHDRTLKAIKLFEEKNPNIKIKPEFTGWDGYWDKLATQAAGKRLPDVIQMDYAYLGEYVSRNLLVDLNKYVDSGTLNFKDVDEGYLVGGKIDGKLYAVNLGANSPAVAYDPEMLKEAGVPEPQPGYTWDDLEKWCKQLKDKFGKDYYPIGGTFSDFGLYLRERGASLYSPDGKKLGYDDDKMFVDFYSYWNKLRKEGLSAPPDITQSIKGLEDEMIVHKKAAFLFFNSNQIVALQKAANRPLKLALFPSVPGGMEGHYLKPSQFFSVSANSKHPEEAAKFIDFFTNSTEANDILMAERGVPISSKVRDYLSPKMEDSQKEMFNYMEVVQKHNRPIDPPAPPGGSEVGGVLTRLQDQMNFDQITADQAAKKFREEATKILEKQK